VAARGRAAPRHDRAHRRVAVRDARGVAQLRNGLVRGGAAAVRLVLPGRGARARAGRTGSTSSRPSSSRS
jgi:hypothetical protein